MLSARTRFSPRLTPHRIHTRQPSNRRFFIQSLCDGFLDLAIALPLPSSVPLYSATIILVTVASRLALFPVALWARNRVRRLEDVVLPELERLKPIISKQVLDEMKQTGVPKKNLVPAMLQQMHLSRMKEKFASERKRLITEHNCNPLLAMVVSPASQIPVFVIMTTMFNRLAQDPTPLDSEAFLSLGTLNHTDETWTLPIILGMVTMFNVQSSNWLVSAFEKDRMRKMEERRAEQMAATGKFILHPQSIIKGGLNVLSVARIVVAGMSPGSVVIYWTTSAILGLLQTWVLEYWPAKQLVRSTVTTIVRNPVPAAPAKTPVVLTPSPKKRKKTRSSHSW